MTSNALLTDLKSGSDSYYWIKNLSYLNIDSNTLLLWISYKDFSKFSSNDVLNWKIIYSIANKNFSNNESSFDLGIGGQNYTSISPESTEDSYDNIFLSVAWLKTINNAKIENLFFEPGYQFTRYDDSIKRNDQRFYFNIGKDFIPSFRTKLSPIAEIGIISSTNSIYNKNYFELGLDVNWILQERLKLIAFLYNRSSWYPQRTLSSPRLSKTGQGNQKQLLSQSETEAINAFHFEISILNEFKFISAKATLAQTNQKSKSNLENYDELEVKISLMTSF